VFIPSYITEISVGIRIVTVIFMVSLLQEYLMVMAGQLLSWRLKFPLFVARCPHLMISRTMAASGEFYYVAQYAYQK
jgi:hypothetical protein